MGTCRSAAESRKGYMAGCELPLLAAKTNSSKTLKKEIVGKKPTRNVECSVCSAVSSSHVSPVKYVPEPCSGRLSRMS